MSVKTFLLWRCERRARRAMLAICAACLPLSGLSASTGADGSLAEGVVTNTAVAGITGAVQPPLADIPLAEAPDMPDLRAIGGGSASYYAAKFEGRPTASGERYRAAELTAAHRSLPFGSKVRVTNPATGKSVTVRINDRGPFTPGRVIDVSRSAAVELGLIARGHAPVELALIED